MRNLGLLLSVVLIAAFTMPPLPGERVAELSELGDVIEAVGESDALFLLSFCLEAAANILLFVPLGAALSFRGASIGRAAGYGLVLSALVEGTQWFVIPGRTTSLDDVALNALGAALGHALHRTLSRARG